MRRDYPHRQGSQGFGIAQSQLAVGHERIQYIPPHPGIGQRNEFQSQGAARSPHVTQVGQRGHTLGRGKELGPQAGMSGVQGRVYAITTSAELADRPVIQGTFLLSRLWARVLFDSCTSHSFIAASVVIELG